VSLSKTTKETNRDYTQLEKYPVYETLPAYFELEYPKFTAFLDKYYRHSFGTGPAKLLRFFSQELLLGRDYFDTFVDKQTAIQTSNLLYRSKGTQYSIQQFFRVFFGFDVDIRYGRDEVFIVGDPGVEELIYTSELRNGVAFPGSRLRFKFDDGEVQAYALAKLPLEVFRDGLYVIVSAGEYVVDQDDYVEDFERVLEYNVYFPLRQEVDFTIDFDDKSVVLQPIPDGYDPVIDDPWINELAQTGVMPLEQKTKIVVKRFLPANSSIGAEVTDKRITNNGFWQQFALSIRAPISIKQWREAYKDFIHPAGVYLEGETLVETTTKLFGAQSSVILEEYKKPAFSEDDILARMQASITELNLEPFRANQLQGYSQSGFVTNDRTPYEDLDSTGALVYVEERLDSDRPDLVYRTRINDIKNFSLSGFTLEELDTQYQRMDRIDTIDPRRFDNVEADFSGTVNTTDENVWYGNPNTICESLDSSYEGPTVLGNLLDFPPEYAGCPGYIFNIFGLTRPLRGYASTEGGPLGDNYNLVAGIAQQSYRAYRDERVWGTTNDPGTNAPGQAFDYSVGDPSSSLWQDEMDYANPFDYAIVNGVARTVRSYFLGNFIDLSPGTPSPGDPQDYMADVIVVDSAGGQGLIIAAYDSAWDSLSDIFGP
jgi:hypothetical protein